MNIICAESDLLQELKLKLVLKTFRHGPVQSPRQPGMYNLYMAAIPRCQSPRQPVDLQEC